MDKEKTGVSEWEFSNNAFDSTTFEMGRSGRMAAKTAYVHVHIWN